MASTKKKAGGWARESRYSTGISSSYLMVIADVKRFTQVFVHGLFSAGNSITCGSFACHLGANLNEFKNSLGFF